MKIGLYLIVISTLLTVGCASKKTLESESTQSSDEMSLDQNESTPLSNTESPTTKKEEATTKTLSEAEQQSIFLEEQKIQAEKDAAEERKRLLELRESLAKFEEESQDEQSMSNEAPSELTNDAIEKEEIEISMDDLPKTNVESPIANSSVNEIQENTSSPVGGNDDYYSEGDFVIQFFASIHGDKSFTDLSKFGKIIVQQVPERSLYRYNIGYFRNRIEAEIVLAEVRSTGWYDAFVREK